MTIIGLAFGAGAIGVGLVALASSVLILGMIPYVESMIKNDWYSDLGMSFIPSACSVEMPVNVLVPLGVKVKGIDIDEDLENDRCQATLHLRYKRKHGEIHRCHREVPGVSRISFQS